MQYSIAQVLERILYPWAAIENCKRLKIGMAMVGPSQNIATKDRSLTGTLNWTDIRVRVPFHHATTENEVERQDPSLRSKDEASRARQGEFAYTA